LSRKAWISASLAQSETRDKKGEVGEEGQDFDVDAGLEKIGNFGHWDKVSCSNVSGTK
jgi:hypothetical protein